jgi:hypothetical protein
MRGVARWANRVFAGIGVVLTAILVTGLVLDVSNFDRTRGGYSPPYEGWTGEPIDWSQTDVTAQGMARRGYVTTLLVYCTTGMVEVEVFRQRIPFRPLSERAIVVHRPREACVARGFSPRF